VQTEIANEIRRAFRYLFEEHGFSFESERHFDSFANWAVVLQSPKCGRIRIMQDRGEVFLALGPQWPSLTWDAGPWYGLEVVVKYLSGGRDRFESGLGPVSDQLGRLADRFRPYVDASCNLFQEDTYEVKRSELEEVRQHVEDEVWKGLTDNMS
jgi:hypothetical protein